MKGKIPVNFLYLGGDKCGSTWLWHILSQHPDVSLARSKELFYFDRFYDKGPNWYVRQFSLDSKSPRVGEICHDYLYSDTALQRIAVDLPEDSRFLITVRDPVARAISHWKYARKVGKTRLSFEEEIEFNPRVIDNSLFGKHVQNAISHLGSERVTVLDFGVLGKDPQAFGRDVSKALGIRFISDLPYSNKVLEAKSARNPYVVGVLRKFGWALRHLGLPRVVSVVKSSPLVAKILYSPEPVSEHIDDFVQEKLRIHFSEDQLLLKSLLSKVDEF